MSSPTPTPIQLSTDGGVAKLPGITSTSAAEASRCLSENHEQHHILYNQAGYHNHLVHQVLALFDLGATPSAIRNGYERESSYQRSIDLDHSVPIIQISPSTWGPYLEKPEYYLSFLRYFQGEISEHGYEAVINTTCFSDTDSAADMFARLWTGFLHPFISLGYGVEFQQPAIVAEGLAMAAVQDGWMTAALRNVEEMANVTLGGSEKTLEGLMREICNDPKIAAAVSWDDPSKVKALLKQAPEELSKYIAQWKVPIEKLEQKTAEAINAAALMVAAAQRPDKEIKMDFFLMHSHNAAIFLPTFISQPWLSDSAKARIIEWKGRLDLALYASTTPTLRINDISDYVPKIKSESNPWMNVIDRVIQVKDDGHAAKFIRACVNGQRFGVQYQDQAGFVVKGDMWLKIAQMCIDSVEEKGAQWVRHTGFDEAWEEYGPRVKH